MFFSIQNWPSPWTVAALVALMAFISTGAIGDDKVVSFARDVRPVLSDRCFQCHGPDRLTREADLRFDDAESVFRDRDGRRIVVPGDTTVSELIRRMTTNATEEKMPPADSGMTLNDEEIELILRWVEQGAEWETHWAYIAPVQPDLPDVTGWEWVCNPIDRFVLARLEDAGLSPAPEADRRTLLRRVSFDLTGLPPTPSEIAEFLNDDGPDAYERVVERLLDSGRYGEQMALPWLEAARYADTSGYQEDYGRYMYPWRTWVIQAFNNNMPFDQFVVEQMAGDLLPNPTHEQKLATAFNRHHRINQEVGAIPDEFIVEYAIDRLETVGTVFLGTTIGCARCHDHKYDPFSQREFYGLYAFLNNCDDDGLPNQSRFGFCKPFLEHPTAQQQVELDRLQAAYDHLDSQETPSVAEQAAFSDWLAQQKRQMPLGLSNWYSIGSFEHDGATRITGFNETFINEPIVDLEQKFGERTWREQPNWPSTGPAILGGEFSTFYLFREIDADAPGAVTIDVGASDALKVWVNGELIFSRSEEGENVAQAEPMPVSLRRGRNEMLFKLSNGGFGQTFVFQPRDRETVPPDVFLALDKAEAMRSLKEQDLVYAHFHRTHLEAIQQEIDDFKQGVAKVMIMKERDDVRPAHLLRRGSYDQKQELVKRSVPSILPPMPDDAPRDRLGLARWLVSGENPLTARVTVNRFWQSYFGIGLVETTEDFGAQGEWPSHPELLDWLATEFVRTEWDVKQMQRLIVNSATYRQSSRSNPELNERDPGNRLLARGPRFRLRPQEIRDQALFVSGLLVERMGGPSVKPYQPEGLWADVSNLLLQEQWYLTNTFQQDHGENLYRRSLYTFWKRSVPPPNMTVFDAGAREVCSVRRQSSNTPLQAMTLLNDVTYVESARHIAHRMLIDGGDNDTDRLRYGMELVTSRLPSDSECAILQRGLARHRKTYRKHPPEAAILLSHGESPSPGNHEATEHAAFTQIALMLLNLDEAITKH